MCWLIITGLFRDFLYKGVPVIENNSHQFVPFLKFVRLHYDKPMKQQGLWSDLPENIRLQLESHATHLDLKRGDKVYSQGEQPRGIFFIEEGLIGLLKLGISGKEHLLRFFRKGQFFGHRTLFSNEEYHGSAIALQPTRIKMIPRDVVYALFKEHPEMLGEVVIVLAKELRRCEDQHVMILDNQIDARVAQALIYLKDLHPMHNWTRQEIANFCASTVSTVIKSLAELEAKGFIAQNGRVIEILDRDGLIALQDEN